MYHCIHCASTITDGLLCPTCIAGQASSTFPVRFCNFCGAAMPAGRRGTECVVCETAREARFLRVTMRIRKVSGKTSGEQVQPTLWQEAS